MLYIHMTRCKIVKLLSSVCQAFDVLDDMSIRWTGCRVTRRGIAFKRVVLLAALLVDSNIIINFSITVF